MHARLVKFGEIEIDGQRYDHDVIVERGKVSKRHKGPSKALRGAYGHTPLSAAEKLPWHCRILLVGTGAEGSLPVTDDVREEAQRRGIDLVVVPTDEACRRLAKADPEETAAVLHVTC